MRELDYINNKDIAREWFVHDNNDLNSAKFLFKYEATTIGNNLLSLATKCIKIS